MPLKISAERQSCAPVTLGGFLSKLIAAIAFTLPFSIFCLDLGGGGDSRIEPAQFLSILLMVISGSCLLWRGKFQRLQLPEKAVLLCLGVAIISLFEASCRFGLQYQVIKGSKQIIGLTFVAVLFLSVRRSITTPAAFRKVAKWLWRGCLILAILGLWQSVALNLLHIGFLADWKWVDKILNHSWLWSGRQEETFGPIIRAKSLALEPAHYCQILIISLGLVVCRLFPPRLLKKTQAGKVGLPSLGLAIIFLLAYLLSFSLVGVFGLIIVLLSHFILFRLLNFKKLLALSILGISTIAILGYLSGGLIWNKMTTISMISPNAEREITPQALSALVLAAHLNVTLASMAHDPLMGRGIGGHRTNFDLYAPQWTSQHRHLSSLNVDDACSLSLRLLSEMGIIGLLTFGGTFALIIFRGWRAVKLAIPHTNTWEILPLCAGLLTGAIAEVLVILVRGGGYFQVFFWFILILASKIPEILRQQMQEPSRKGPGLAAGLPPPVHPIENVVPKDNCVHTII